MAAPARDRRGRAVQVVPAARRRPRRSGPRSAAFGNLDWKTWSDPDGQHEPLLDVSRIVALGDFAIAAPSPSGRSSVRTAAR